MHRPIQQASEDERQKILELKLKEFFSDQDKAIINVVASTEQTQDQHQPEDQERRSVGSESSGSDERPVITWTSEPILSLPNQSNFSTSEPQTNRNDTTSIMSEPQPQPKPEQPKQPIDYDHIIANTKFEQQEQLDLDGFPANNYIYCIEPATGDPDSFDVGTYGMIIFIFSANNRRSNGLVGRLKKDGKKYRWTQILQVSGQGSSIFKYRGCIILASSPIFPCFWFPQR